MLKIKEILSAMLLLAVVFTFGYWTSQHTASQLFNASALLFLPLLVLAILAIIGTKQATRKADIIATTLSASVLIVVTVMVFMKHPAGAMAALVYALVALAIVASAVWWKNLDLSKKSNKRQQSTMVPAWSETTQPKSDIDSEFAFGFDGVS